MVAEIESVDHRASCTLTSDAECRTVRLMRTTLELDDDLVVVAKDLAKTEGRTIGQIISSLARQGLRASGPVAAVRNGVPLFVPNMAAPRPDLPLVNALRDDL